jgi:hypothetical protein
MWGKAVIAAVLCVAAVVAGVAVVLACGDRAFILRDYAYGWFFPV